MELKPGETVTDGSKAAENLIKELADAAEERLDPELVPFLSIHQTLGQILQHPLVYEVPYHRLPGMVNKRLHAKQKLVDDYISKKEYGKALWLYERPYRISFLDLWQSEFTSEDFKDQLSMVWSDAEMPSQFSQQKLIGMFKRAGYLTDEEDSRFRPTGDIPVFRGVQKEEFSRGMSWTTSPQKARWFALRWNIVGTGYVYAATAPPESQLAFFSGRGEQEVVVDPQHLVGFRLHETVRKNDGKKT